jgi:two-component system response regulator FlrC
MRLLIVGTLNGQLTTATKLAMDKGAKVTHATDIAKRWRCCAPAVAPIS